MTRRPISVQVGTPFRAVAAILSGRRIGAVPVIDGRGRPIGVVSEVDVVAAGLRGRDLGGITAGELMTSPVVTTGVDVPVAAAVRRLADAGVRRLFVVDEGRLVGVVSRRDLLRGYLRDDEDIREQVERTVSALGHEVVRASVEGGVVLLVGRVEWRSALAGIDAVVRAVPGVVEVRDRIGYQWDDGDRSMR